MDIIGRQWQKGEMGLEEVEKWVVTLAARGEWNWENGAVAIQLLFYFFLSNTVVGVWDVGSQSSKNAENLVCVMKVT